MANIDFWEEKDILELAEQLHVPECIHGLDRPLKEKDFTSYIELMENKVFNLSNSLKKKLDKKSNNILELISVSEKFKNFVVHLIILCGEHSDLAYWSTKSTIKVTKEIADHLVKLFCKSSIDELILDNSHYIFGHALILLRPKLLKTTWKCNPAAVLSYYWLLTKVKAPFLSEHLTDVLPTALIINDDFETSNRIKGLNCISHIVSNVTRAELEMYGQNDVILENLRRILFYSDVDVLEPLMKCFVALMQKMESPIQCRGFNRSKFDDIFEVVLNNIDLEQKNEVKIVYLSYLSEMISIFRLRTLRHTRRLFDLIGRELNTESNDQINCLLLQLLDNVIKFCWLRLNFEKEFRDVILSLFKLLHNHSSLMDANQSTNHDLINCIRNTFNLLKCLMPNQFDQIIYDIKNSETLLNNFKILVESV